MSLSSCSPSFPTNPFVALQTLVSERDNEQRRSALGKQVLLLLLDLPLASFYIVLLLSWRNPNVRAATNSKGTCFDDSLLCAFCDSFDASFELFDFGESEVVNIF